MPITVGIPGGGSPGYITTLQSVDRSITVRSAPVVESTSSLSIAATNNYRGLESIDVRKISRPQFMSSRSIVYITRQDAIRVIEVTAGDSFMLLVDVIEEVLSSSYLAEKAGIFINARLKVNGVEVPISSFDYQVPTGRLGSLLNVKLAKADPSLVPIGATITFDILVNDGIEDRVYKLLESGKLQGRDAKIAYRGGQNGGPNDEVTFGTVDVMTSKFTLAPRRPVIMYDPNRVKITEISTKVQDLTRNENGIPIFPVVEPVYGLKMKQVLARAYTSTGGHHFMSSLSSSFISSGRAWIQGLSSTANDQIGMGFDRVITNISDYPIRRADWSIDGSWHDGAQSFVAMYGPVYFVRDNILYIIDADQKLPYAVTAHDILISNHKALSEAIKFQPESNAVILRYQYSPFDEGEDVIGRRTIIEDDTVPDAADSSEDIDTFADGYTATRTRREYTEVYLILEPDTILDTQENSLLIQNFTNLAWPQMDDDGNVTYVRRRGVLTHEEETTYEYSNDLQDGYTKTIRSAVYYEYAVTGTVLQDVSEEKCHVTWIDDPTYPGRKIQDKVVTNVTGWTYIDPDSETIDDSDGSELDINRAYPILLAQASGIIDRDSVDRNWVPISTEVKTLHRIKDNQYNVLVVKKDLLNNSVSKTTTSPVTGSAFTDPYATRGREVLYRDLVSEAAIGPRVPVKVNSYELPRPKAIKLAKNVLKRLNNPLKTLPIEMAAIDFAVDRGSVVRGQTRDSYTANYLVTGWALTGTNLGRRGHRISQRLEGAELLTT